MRILLRIIQQLLHITKYCTLIYYMSSDTFKTTEKTKKKHIAKKDKN